MKERPILFSGPMVRALLAGTKIQTRRVIKPEWWRCLDPDDEDDRAQALLQCPYGSSGDRLWVREAWDAPPGSELIAEVAYRADFTRDPEGARWRPSIHMPRWASRITLEITDVRVERLQDISEDDARAEGVDITPPRLVHGHLASMSARENFQALWHDINGKRASWESNPWLWVVSFQRVQQ